LPDIPVKFRDDSFISFQDIRENALHWLSPMLEPGGAPQKWFWGYKWGAVDP